MKSINKEWYEAVNVGGFGCKLAETFNTLEEAQKGIEESNARAVSRGYKEENFYIMKCMLVRVIDDNNDVISEIIGRYKVS